MKTLPPVPSPLRLAARITRAAAAALRLPLSRAPLLSALLTFTFTLTFTSLARAQWQTPTYALRGGWNAIYLHGDATHATPDQLFAANPEIISVWRWIPNPNPVQINTSTLVPSSSSPEWAVWVRGQPGQTTLASLPGQSAYLVRCSGVSTDNYALTIPQRTLPPRSTWARNGANLLGFPTRLATTYPSFTQYFATFPAAIAAETTIFKYVGGDIGPANPVQIFSTATERVDRHQAYWFDATVVGNFYAPLEITPSNLDGLTFGRTGALITVRVRNRTAAPVTLNIAPVASAVAPVGQEAVVAPVPLTRRTFNAATVSYTDTPITAAFDDVIPPQSSVELVFGIDRAQLTGADGALYASFLRFTDSGNLLDVYLPASARKASLAGLWVGDATVTHVQSQVAGAAGATTPRSFPLRVLLHVDDAGTARLLSQVFMGKLAQAPHAFGLCTLENGLKADEKSTASRLFSIALPLDQVIGTGSGSVALGSTLVRTVSVPHTASTNPFVHAYHPDHDNKDPRGGALPAGIESYTVSRVCTFAFTTTPPEGVSSVGWGASAIGGTYTEVVTGLHKNPLTVSGTFVLRRVSELGSIMLN